MDLFLKISILQAIVCSRGDVEKVIPSYRKLTLQEIKVLEINAT